MYVYLKNARAVTTTIDVAMTAVSVANMTFVVEVVQCMTTIAQSKARDYNA